MVKGSEQHGEEGIDFGDSPETIRERGTMWSNVRSDLRNKVQLKHAEDLHDLEGKRLTSATNDLVRTEVRRRLNQGEFENLREKVMLESWEIFEKAQDVDKMTPFAIEKLLDTYVATAEAYQPPSETPEESAIREKEEGEKKRAEMKESIRETQEQGAEREEVHSLADEMERKKESFEMARWMQMMLDKGQAVEKEPEQRKQQFEQWKKESGKESERKVA